MKVLQNLSSDIVVRFVQKTIDQESVLFADKNPANLNLVKMVESPMQIKSTKDSMKANLPLVHVTISNLKTIFREFFTVSVKITSITISIGEQLFNRLVVASIYP